MKMCDLGDALRTHRRLITEKFDQNWFILSWDIKSWICSENGFQEKEYRISTKDARSISRFKELLFTSWEPNWTTYGWITSEIEKSKSLHPCAMVFSKWTHRFAWKIYSDSIFNKLCMLCCSVPCLSYLW